MRNTTTERREKKGIETKRRERKRREREREGEEEKVEKY